MSQPLQTLVLLTVVFSAFLLFALNSDIFYSSFSPSLSRNNEHPDFKRYRDIRVLASEEFPIDDPDRRVIIVGDIHGMHKPFKRLLERVAYNKEKDILVHAGDTVAKGSHKGSLAIIDYLTRHNITGVRGNHDQKVIEWKGWQDWFATLPGGNDWLSDLHSHWEKAAVKGKKLKNWVKNRRNESRGEDAKWWSLIPKQWVPFGDHYHIAKDLTDEQYSYFLSLPLKLHIPSAHAFIVHAGLLPYDLQYDFDDHKRQPLARAPRIRADILRFNQGNIDAMRTLQERSVLQRVPHNTDPWVNLNVRSVVKDRDLSSSAHKGVPWADYWNGQMSMCAGFKSERAIQIQSDAQIQLGISKTKELPCHPFSVIYGHCASRGLDIDRWTFGLDSGCVAGKKLTAMILGPNSSLSLSDVEDDDDGHRDDDHFDGASVLDEDHEGNDAIKSASPLKRERTIPFGEDGAAKIVQVSCKGQH
ncbi:hypothetical protein AGABI1DRAFT_114368 [Agaricus bisporus var. burnettii JB137-S8]|uniref:Calcineurin-like phosphoesterase domain-containing protein n=1 Tax=Agaricus bisporus var. burnettii (strain JB137-S8 / ATCC MYA-4627 / FGSC 10392) TaxID=597362 RepID=K5VWC0_AGABU|nr:uncharacterized protein AGABI1DRAFT_114368 [Agaricus bisporus var. burnettii JB137-S8]EKM78774.1 hypothetical protein AGABI1DRAFT_114368 [Agaricus bisporus var. burnettii JB137-S8]